jgi:hypothetical protein
VEATEMLLQQVQELAGDLTRAIERKAGQDDPRLQDWATTLHSQGINVSWPIAWFTMICCTQMRHLGLLRSEVLKAAHIKEAAVPAHLDEALLLEMAIRVMKNRLREHLREKHRLREDDVSE